MLFYILNFCIFIFTPSIFFKAVKPHTRLTMVIVMMRITMQNVIMMVVTAVDLTSTENIVMTAYVILMKHAFLHFLIQ